MKYEKAEELVNKSEDFVSADFFRMQTAKSIALGLRDEPQVILMDVLLHGNKDTKNLLQFALQEGYVVQHETEEGVPMLDVCDVENVAGAPYNFMSHIAMQIAYPALYWEYYGGEHVWTYSNEKMQVLLKLCMSCLSDSRHPSDYFGEHEFVDDTGTKEGKAPKPVKVANTGHKNWVVACQEHKKSISAAWANYIEICAKRKGADINWDKWKEEEMEPLRQQMEAITEQCNAGKAALKQEVARAFKVHSDLKNSPKPQVGEYK